MQQPPSAATVTAEETRLPTYAASYNAAFVNQMFLN